MFKSIVNYWNTIKVFFKIKGELKNMKLAELSTSSGRMTLALNIVAIYLALQGILPAALVAKIALISVGFFAMGRAILHSAEAIAKITATTKDDEIVAEAKKVLDILSRISIPKTGAE